jgi:two-component system, LytTR family, sensor histidine kinase AlgZ
VSKPPSDEPEFAATASRATSLWPDSTRAGGAASTNFAHSRFDPIAEDRARLQQQAAAAFDVCHPALALRAVLLVQAVLVVVALGSADSLANWGPQQAALAFVGVAGTLLWLVAVCACKAPLHRAAPPLRAALVLLLGALAALLAWLPLWWADLAGATGGLRVAALLLGGMGFAALLWAWLDLRSRIWHPAHAAARLAELQSRIRPHFLFNALNTALALVRVDPERAESVLEDLAELFRTALADAGASVALEEEIELARRYLAIEQVRFGERLQVQWQIDTRDRRVALARVPPLVLQPLVENAVRHGVEPSARGGLVRVTANVQRGQVVVMVSNTVGDEPGLPGHGMALHNVRERLRLLHDMAAQCDVWREPGLHHPAAASADAQADTFDKPGPDLHGDVFHARIVLPLL